MGTVLVIGGINQDVTVQAERRPAGGETLVGDGPTVSPGGKGANQAAAAAFAGADVLMCGVVGDDGAGREQLDQLREAGVDVSGVRVARGCSTGAALIVITPDGENSIVVGSGANAFLGLEDVAAALTRPVDVVLAQTEPGVGAVEAAAREAALRSIRLVVNAAPTAGVSKELLAACDPLVVNEHEARDLLREHEGDADLPAAGLGPALHELLGARSVVVSLGPAGAVVVDRDGAVDQVSAPRVTPVDTTGAGDMLVGVIAARLSQGVQLVAAVRDACEAAATAVTTAGARGYLTPSS